MKNIFNEKYIRAYLACQTEALTTAKPVSVAGFSLRKVDQYERGVRAFAGNKQRTEHE